MIRKLLLVLLLPLVWVPLIVFMAWVIPSVPWWAWAFALVFVVLFVRRRRLAAAGLLTGSFSGDEGPRFSPFRGSGL